MEMEKFVAEVKAIDPEHKGLAENLVRRIKSYAHWPDSKRLGLKLRPFIESKEMIFLLADILKNNRQWQYNELLTINFRDINARDRIGYATFVHLFILYVFNKKEKSEEIISILGCLVDSAIETVMRDEFDNKYYMLRCIFDIYKVDKDPFLSQLAHKFDTVPNDKLMFRLIDEGTSYKVSAYSTFTCGDVKIPPYYKEKPVKKIDSYAFQYCKKLTGIVIPEGIEVIGYNAFKDCGNLKNIVFPKSVKHIGDNAFCYCYKLKEVVIPENVIEMGEMVFYEIKKMSNIRVIGYTEKPEGWDKDWHKNDYFCESFHHVIWNYKE